MFAYWNDSYYVVIALQVLCIVHALRTGRRDWIYLLIFVPLVGAVIYFVWEIIPEISSGEFSSNLQRVFFPTARTRDRERRLKISDSVTNRLLLSDAYADQGRFADAIPLVQSCMTDLYVSDRDLLMRMARLCFLDGRYQDSIDYFSRGLYADNLGMNRMEDEILYARAVEASGDLERAESMYQKTIRKHQSLEARYWYGMLLKRLERGREAREQFKTVCEDFDLHPRYVRKMYIRWVRLSKKELWGL